MEMKFYVPNRIIRLGGTAPVNEPPMPMPDPAAMFDGIPVYEDAFCPIDDVFYADPKTMAPTGCYLAGKGRWRREDIARGLHFAAMVKWPNEYPHKQWVNCYGGHVPVHGQSLVKRPPPGNIGAAVASVLGAMYQQHAHVAGVPTAAPPSAVKVDYQPAGDQWKIRLTDPVDRAPTDAEIVEAYSRRMHDMEALEQPVVGSVLVTTASGERVVVSLDHARDAWSRVLAAKVAASDENRRKDTMVYGPIDDGDEA